MMLITLTPEIVEGLWKELSSEFDLTLANKQDVSEMRIVAEALQNMNIMSAETFLERYATTVGQNVYLPFRLGDESGRSLLSQACTISHESQHGYQFIVGGASWQAAYLLDPNTRASSEAEAATTTCEVYYACTGKILDPHERAEFFRPYMLDDPQIQTIEARLKSTYKTIEHGGVITNAGITATRYLSKFRQS